MGRFQPSARLSFGDMLRRMETEYRDALVSVKRREAFDGLVKAWSSELGAISYAENLTLLDLILLTGEVDNRALIESLRLRVDVLESRLDKVSSCSP